jgi:hypothetical protein
VPPGEIGSCGLVLQDPAGVTVATKALGVKDGSIRISLSPVQGSPGSPATVTIEGTGLRGALNADRPLFAASDLIFKIDYSRSGGASGPRMVPFPQLGAIRFDVTRGSTPGAFQLIVIPDLRKRLFSATTCAGGRVPLKGRAMFLNPHARRSLPGCPYCASPPGPKPANCPGESHDDGRGGLIYLSGHAWGKQPGCKICG